MIHINQSEKPNSRGGYQRHNKPSRPSSPPSRPSQAPPNPSSGRR